MEKNIDAIVKALEKEKCPVHRYMPLVYVEKSTIKINACCDVFQQKLEEKAKAFIENGLYELDEY